MRCQGSHTQIKFTRKGDTLPMYLYGHLNTIDYNQLSTQVGKNRSIVYINNQSLNYN